jgi:hypothetical protein
LATDLLAILAALLVTLTALVLLTSDDWRLNMIFLALQSAGVWVLLTPAWPLAMSVSQVISGWLSSAILGLAAAGSLSAQMAAPAGPGSKRKMRRQQFSINPFFFLLAALLGGMAFLSQIPALMNFIPDIGLAQAWGGLILIGLGLLRLGFSERPLPITAGLLTSISGFTILAAFINTQPLTAGLLAGLNLALALAGAYLINVASLEAN